MEVIIKALFSALRSSELWVLMFQAYVEARNAPVPEEFQAAGWVYIAARVLSRLVKFAFPNPANPSGGFLKND